MEVIREFRRAVTNEVRVHLPEGFINKEIEITVKTINNRERVNRKKGKVLFNAIQLDTRGFKFNREEANER